MASPWEDLLIEDMHEELAQHLAPLARLCLALTSPANHARYANTARRGRPWTRRRIMRQAVREYPGPPSCLLETLLAARVPPEARPSDEGRLRVSLPIVAIKADNVASLSWLRLADFWGSWFRALYGNDAQAHERVSHAAWDRATMSAAALRSPAAIKWLRAYDDWDPSLSGEALLMGVAAAGSTAALRTVCRLFFREGVVLPADPSAVFDAAAHGCHVPMLAALRARFPQYVPAPGSDLTYAVCERPVRGVSFRCDDDDDDPADLAAHCATLHWLLAAWPTVTQLVPALWEGVVRAPSKSDAGMLGLLQCLWALHCPAPESWHALVDEVAVHGHVETMAWLLAPERDAFWDAGTTEVACAHGQLALLRAAVARGWVPAVTEPPTFFDAPALCFALEGGHMDTAVWLVREQDCPLGRERNMHTAVTEGAPRLAQWLLARAPAHGPTLGLQPGHVDKKTGDFWSPTRDHAARAQRLPTAADWDTCLRAEGVPAALAAALAPHLHAWAKVEREE